MLNLEARQLLIDQILTHMQQVEPQLPEGTEQMLGADWALALEATPAQKRHQLWLLIPEELRAQALSLLREEFRVGLLNTLEQEELINATQQVSSDQAVGLIGRLKPNEMAQVMASITDENQNSTLKAAMEYDDDEVGRYIVRDFLVYGIDSDLNRVKQQALGGALHSQQYVYVTDGKGRYLGRISPMALMASEQSAEVADLLSAEEDYIQDTESTDNLSDIFKRYNCAELPVLDSAKRIVGLFYAKDVLAFVEEYFEAKLAHVGKVSDEDLFAPVMTSARQRAIWLGINLLTALLAAWVIGMFEATLDKVVALAVLMPIVASMGGIAGSQSLTLTIRGLATNQLSDANISLLRNKEFKVVVINSVIWAVSVASIAMVWFEQWVLALILGFAVIVNMIVAVLCGIAIPYVMHKMKIDPALAGSVVLTTVSDVVGFFVFLGLATIFLL